MHRIKALLLLFIFVFHSLALSSETKWLVKQNHFRIGTDEEGYRALTDLRIIKQGIIILENYPGHRILSYSKDGKLLKTMGKMGKEPGELAAPIEISLWKDEIAVKDNSGLSIFRTDGSFVRRVNPFVNIVSFVYIKDKIYLLTATPDKKSLIDVFTPEGEFLFDCGEGFFELDYSKYKHMSPIHAKGFVYEGKLLSDGENLYYLNASFGNVLVFSLKGEKIAEYNITSIFGEEGEQVAKSNTKLWLEEGIDLEKTKRRIPTKEMFRDAFLYQDKIYVLTRKIIQLEEGYKQENEIIVLDKKSFRLIDSFKVKKNDDEGVLALAVVAKDNEPIFHFTMWIRDKACIYSVYRREK